MQLTRIHISRFRNIGRIDLDPGAGAHLFFGANAQGKTNTLEAIYYLVTGRSFRTRLDRECLPLRDLPGAPTLPAGTPMIAVIEGDIQRRVSRHRLRVVVTPDGKNIFLDDKPLERLGLLWGKLNAILFTPDDLALIKGGPSERRAFLDTELAQVDPLYLDALQRFDRALRQRNALLRRTGPQGAEHPGTLDALRRHLDAFEQPMAEAAVMVTERRAAALERLSTAATEAYRMISGGAEALKLQYRPALATASTAATPEASDHPTDSPSTAYLKRLHDGLAQDLRRGSTQHGPHRDDFIVTLAGRDARDFASQGQQRSCVLALRLAEIDWMREATGEPPLLLLDDIVSELDEQRRARLLQAIPPDVQTFMTATNAEVLEGRFQGTRHFEVRQGALA